MRTSSASRLRATPAAGYTGRAPRYAPRGAGRANRGTDHRPAPQRRGRDAAWRGTLAAAALAALVTGAAVTPSAPAHAQRRARAATSGGAPAADAATADRADGRTDLPPEEDLGDGGDGGGARGPLRPTSDAISVHSGRTLGIGEAVLSAGVGWPGLFAELTLAPSSRFNLGVRGSVLYGSPLVGIGDGIGGEVSIPIRFLLHARRAIDISLMIRPGGVFGQGALVGEEGTFSNDFAWGVRLEAGAVMGIAASDAVTLLLGALLGGGLGSTPDAGGDLQGYGAGYLQLGVEGLVSRDMMLFALADVGGGFGGPDRFDGNFIGRMWLGVGYLL
jgi:hypothetical protein